MEDFMIKDSDGDMMNISLIGSFRISELEKEYIMYSLVDDDENNENGHILLGEIVRGDDGNVQVLGILPEEKDLVVAYYNEISTQLGGEEDE